MQLQNWPPISPTFRHRIFRQGPDSPWLTAVKDFAAFTVAYLPSELSSVLSVLLLGTVPLKGSEFWFPLVFRFVVCFGKWWVI